MKYIIFIFSLLCSLISNVCSAGGAEKLLESVCRKKPNLSYCSNYSTTTGVPTTRNKIITRATTTTTTTRRPTSVLTRKNDLVPFPFGLDNSKKNVSQPKIDPKVLKELEGIKQVQHSSFQHSNHWGFNEAEAKKVFNNFMAREEAIKKRLEEEKKKSTKATSPKMYDSKMQLLDSNLDDNDNKKLALVDEEEKVKMRNKGDNDLDPFSEIETRPDTDKSDSQSFNQQKAKFVSNVISNKNKLPIPLPSTGLGYEDRNGLLKDLGDMVNINWGIGVPVHGNDPVRVGGQFGVGFGKSGSAGGMPDIIQIPKQGWKYSLNDYDGWGMPVMPNRAYKYWKKVYKIEDSSEEKKIEQEAEKPENPFH